MGEEDFVKGEGVFFFIGKTCTKFHSDIWKPCSTIISCLLSKRVLLNCNFFLPKHVGYLFYFVLQIGSSIFCTSWPSKEKENFCIILTCWGDTLGQGHYQTWGQVLPLVMPLSSNLTNQNTATRGRKPHYVKIYFFKFWFQGLCGTKGEGELLCIEMKGPK